MVMMAEGAGSNICSQSYPTSRDWKGRGKVNRTKRENYIVKRGRFMKRGRFFITKEKRG